MKRPILIAAVGALAVCAAAPACAQSAIAQLQPTQGNTATGTVTFTQEGSRVAMEAKISGLAPGSHGFHIHDKGDCSAADGMSAGGHFNPTGKPHGNPNLPDHHAGDMPVLLADASGNASLSADLDVMTIGGGGATGIVGKAVIVHKNPDDFTTQPTGNSGARVACGVIRNS